MQEGNCALKMTWRRLRENSWKLKIEKMRQTFKSIVERETSGNLQECRRESLKGTKLRRKAER